MIEICVQFILAKTPAATVINLISKFQIDVKPFQIPDNLRPSVVIFKHQSGVSSHHQRHLELLEEFNHHAEDLANGLKTIDQFLGFLTDWFVGHTIYEDKTLFKKNI